MNTGQAGALNVQGHYHFIALVILSAWLGLGEPLLRGQNFQAGASVPQPGPADELIATEIEPVPGTDQAVAAVIPLPPEINPQPQDQAAAVGSRAVLSCGVLGAKPQRYQWYYAGQALTNQAGRITGATSARLVLDKLQLHQTGDYWVEVQTSQGTLTSRAARLAVCEPVRIEQQPSSQKVGAGAEVTFSVQASGSAPLQFQWYYRGQLLADATNAWLTLSKVEPAQAGFYLVKVSNPIGSKISGAAVLQVILPPQFTKGLQDASALANGRVVLAASVTGSAPLQFQWYGNGQPLANQPGRVSGATSARLVLEQVQPAQSGAYWLVARNGAGTQTSSAAQVTVWAPVRIVEQPQDLSTAAGTAARFEVVATGSAPLTYQWYREGVALPDETNAVLVLPNVRATQQGNYQVAVRNPVSGVFSRVAKLTIPSPYAGRWSSIRGAAGSVNADRAYFDITIANNGTFSGTYQSYAYSYTYYLTTQWGRYPVPVYNPSGPKRSVHGQVDFEAGSGTATLTGLGTTSFTLTVNEDGSLCFSFPSAFAYTQTVIKR